MTQTTKMTIHRALAELKLIDSRIESGINAIYPSGIHQKGKKIDGHILEEDFIKNAKANYQSVTDLITRKIDIKRKIVTSNAVTTVKVAGKEMTVSDAITYKAIVQQKKKLAAYLKQRNQQAIAALNRNNEVVSKNVEILLGNAYGKDSTKVAKEDLDAISKPYLENNTWNLLDPLGVEKEAASLEKEYTDFETEIDATLSESNSVVFIEL